MKIFSVCIGQGSMGGEKKQLFIVIGGSNYNNWSIFVLKSSFTKAISLFSCLMVTLLGNKSGFI